MANQTLLLNDITAVGKEVMARVQILSFVTSPIKSMMSLLYQERGSCEKTQIIQKL